MRAREWINKRKEINDLVREVTGVLVAFR